MHEDAPPSKTPPPWILWISALVVMVGAGLGLRHGPMGLMRGVGYAVCHQITVRSYIFGTWVMPLCARCTGQYLGVMAGFFYAWRWGRLRAAGLPGRGMLVALLLLLAGWALDGINSYLYLLTQTPFLYTPHNILRLVTGMGQGVAVSMLFLPFFNQVFWYAPDPRPVLTRWRDLLIVLGTTAILTLAVNSRWPILFYPLAVLSTAGVVLLLSLVGLLITVLALGAENQATTWRDFGRFWLPGLAFATLLILGMDVLRAGAEQRWGILHF